MHETLSSFAQTWGLVIFVALFGSMVTYALWPKNQERFNRASMAPLTEADSPEGPAANEEKTDG